MFCFGVNCLNVSKRWRCSTFSSKQLFLFCFFLSHAVQLFFFSKCYPHTLVALLFRLLRELQEARQAALSPTQNLPPERKLSKMDSLPKTGRRLVGRKASRSMSFGCPGYGVWRDILGHECCLYFMFLIVKGITPGLNVSLTSVFEGIGHFTVSFKWSYQCRFIAADLCTPPVLF